MQPNTLRLPRRSTAVLTAVLCLAVPACGRADAPRITGFTLTSSALRSGNSVNLRQVYDRDGCRGGNVSPVLAWQHPPAGTRSFALLMFDSDAPGGGWWHWLVFDIPARVRSLPAGAGNPATHLMPRGTVQSRNDFGSLGYGGPCPPPGPAHHYHLMLYALRVSSLAVSPNAPPGKVDSRVRAAAIAKAQITVLYGR